MHCRLNKKPDLAGGGGGGGEGERNIFKMQKI